MSQGLRTPSRSRDRVRRGIAALVAGLGLVDLASALAPPLAARLAWLHELVPVAVPHLATILVVQIGLALLVLSGQIARGKRRAWQLTLLLLGASGVLHLLKGLDVEEAVVSIAGAGLLVAARGRFTAASDAPSFRRLVRLGPALAGFPFAYGVAGLWVRRGHVVGGWPGLRTALLEVADRAVGLAGPLQYRGFFGRWFPFSITASALAAAGYLLWLAFRPVVRHPVRRSPEEEALLRQLVSRGPDTLSYFLLRDDKLAFLDPSGAAVGYRVLGGVALASGDPVGPPERWPALLQAFVDYAHEHGWRVGALAVGAEAQLAWKALGFRSMPVGDEAVIRLEDFSLEGRPMRTVRQAVANARRRGYHVEWHRSGEVSPDLIRALLHISEGWRGEDVERGFSMTLGRLFDRRDQACLVAVARDAEGFPRGFLHFVPAGPDGYSLDVMRRDRDAPSSLNDLLVAETLAWLRQRGVRRVSLNFAFLRNVLRPEGRLGAWGRLQRRIALALGPWFQIESLYRFNQKFRPTWEPRYLVWEAPLSAPAVALAALRAERLLDPRLLRRGQGGKRLRATKPPRLVS